MNLIKSIEKSFEKSGLKLKVLPISDLDTIKEEIRRSHGLTENKEYHNYMEENFDFNMEARLPGALSLIITALPSYPRPLRFTWKGEDRLFFLPPVLSDRDNVRGDVLAILNELMAPYGYKAAKALLPEKMLAVRSGLGVYGRNNVCYVDGMGSFCRIMAYVSDLPAHGIVLEEYRTLPRCAKCGLCVKRCVAGALSADRFQVDGEKCITYFNEEPGEIPLETSKVWKDTLIGCMECQMKCPENKAFADEKMPEVSFSEEETRLLVEKTPIEKLPESLIEKLKTACLLRQYEILGRNLGILLKK